jgi:hypothetical protein
MDAEATPFLCFRKGKPAPLSQELRFDGILDYDEPAEAEPPMPLKATILFVLVWITVACAPVTPPRGVPREPGPEIVLFDAAVAIDEQWMHMPLRGATDYRSAVWAGRDAIRAVGRNSASGLIRRVRVDPARCPVLEWSWAVTRIQADADLRVRGLEDVAASVFLLFGDPGLVFYPVPVPTLRYVWTNGRTARDAVVDSPYLPGVVRSIVVESGEAGAGTWIVERRNVVADFERAFGHPPRDDIGAVAVFTDNDQTKQPVEAYYGRARMICDR